MAEKQLLWDVTGTCNLLCQHCYAYDKYEWRNKDRIPRRDMDLVASREMLSQAKRMGFGHIHLLGGEPLLRRDILDIIAHIRETLGMKVTMNTNGLPLKPAMIDGLIDLSVYQVSVSFEGTTPAIHDPIRGQGTFERARRNLKALADRVAEREADMLIGVGYVVTRAALGDVKNVFDFAVDNGANGLTLDFLSRDGRAASPGVFEELSCPEDESLTAFEELMATAAGRIPPDFLFQINAKPRVRRYLSERYGVVLRGEAFGDLCPAGEHTVLVENDGVTTPCGILNKKIKNEEAVAEGEYGPERIDFRNFVSLNDLQQSSFFRTFSDFKKRHHGTVPTCRECEFVATCQPCPVDNLHALEVTECVLAEDRRQRWRSEVWDLPLRVTWENPDPSSIGAIGHEVVQGLVQGRPLGEICRGIASDTGAESARVEEDMWEFAMQLRLAGLLDVPNLATTRA